MAVTVHSVRGLLELARGRDADALAAFRAAERLAGLLAAPHYLVPAARARRLQALVRLGEIERAEQALAELGEEDRWRAVDMTPVGAGRFHYKLDAVSASFKYRVLAGAVTSPTYAIVAS